MAPARTCVMVIKEGDKGFPEYERLFSAVAARRVFITLRASAANARPIRTIAIYRGISIISKYNALLSARMEF